MLFFLLGCGPQTDAERYLKALDDPANAAGCEAIADDRLAGECRAMAAVERAMRGDVDGGLAACEAMPASDPWRDECFFLLGDRITATGSQATAICERAGRYQDRCLGHAFGREGRKLLTGVTYGEERQAYRDLRTLSRTYFDDPQTAGKKLWHLMVEFIASRDIEEPFSAATCGGLPDNLCRTGYLTRIRFSIRDARGTEHALHNLCGLLPITVEDAAELGLPSWTADVDPLVQSAWRQFCGSPASDGAR